jgi:H+/gluconate symporter-like permease
VAEAGVAGSFVAGAAHGSGFHLQTQIQGLEHLDGFRDDFGTDAITGQNCNLHDVPLINLIAARCYS